MTAQARMIDAIPVVADATARDAWWPSASRPTYARVFRVDTGNVEQWNGVAWVVVIGTSEAATAPTLINSWAVADGVTVGYWKTLSGTVVLRGRVNGGSAGTVAFVLPAGYRPVFTTYIPIVRSTDGVTSYVAIDTSGNVTIGTAGAGKPHLDGVTFRVDA